MLEVAEEDRHLAEEEDQGAVEEGRHFVPVAEEDQVVPFRAGRTLKWKIEPL